MAKKKNSNLSYDQYVSKYGDKKAGTISYDQYMAKQAEREQQAQQKAREQRQSYINKLAAKATIQKARDLNNPIMNNTGMGQAENARNAFGIGTDKANKRGYVEWLQKLDKKNEEPAAKTDTTGQYGRGNIDLNSRKVHLNGGKSISTERSFSVNIDGKEVLLPTVINGKVVSENEAIEHYKQTGENLGKFNTPAEANAYADILHKRQENYYGNRPIVQRSPGELKTEFMTQKYNQLQEALADRALGFEAVEDSRKKNNTGNDWTLQQQMDIYGDRRKYQAEGRYGDSGLPWYMNDEQRKALREESEKTAQEKRDLAKQYEQFDQDAALGGIYDVMYNRDTANERAILNNPAYAGTDFERNAQATLAGLESQYPTYRRYSQDQARRLLEEGIDLNAETPYEKEKLREQVYDRVMGDNWYKDGTLDTYKERIKGLSYEEKKALDDELDKAISGMAAPWGTDKTQADAIDSLNREAEAYDAQVKAIDSAQTYYDFIQQKRQLAADEWMGNVSSSYDPSLLPEVKMLSEEHYGLVPEPQGSDVEKAYYWANNWQNLGDYANDMLNTNKYMFIAADPEILDMFNKFYAKDKANGYRGELGSNLAQQFLDGLDPYLTSMLVEYQNNFIQSKAQNGFTGTFMRFMSPALQTVGGVTGTIAAITGQDIDSQLYLPTRMAAQTRSRQNEDIGKLADQAFGEFGGNATRFMLGVVDSVADNVFAMNVGTGLAGEGTKNAMRLVQAIMSGSATSNKMVEMLENGTKPDEAALYAIGDGVIEWITERYSLEQIMGPDVKQMFGNKKAIASFVARSAAAEGSEEINSGLLNMGLDYVLSMVYGHENELKQKYNELVTSGMSDEEASRKVLEDKLAELGTEGLAGAISGGMMAESRVISTAIENRGTGKKIKGKQSGTDVMLDLARGMAEGTDSRTLADQLTAEIEKGNEVSNYDLGRLANLTALEVGEQRSQVIKDTVTNNVVQQLKEKGISEEQAQQFAAIISNSIFTGAKLTKAEITTLGQDERAIQLWKDFHTMSAASLNLAKAVNTETKPLDSIANKMGELVSDNVKASSAAAVEIEKSIQETDSMEEAIDNLQARRSGLLSEQYANLAKEYLQNNPETKKNKAYLDDVMKIRLAAMTLDTMPETSLEAEQAKKLYTAAQEEFNQIDEERIKNQRPAMEGQGVTTYKGAEYGTDAWKAATEGLSKTTKNVMGAVGEIAARFGYRVNMVNDPENPDVYGFEDADTGAITINVANGLKHHMLVTMAHEMTHWLEQNSRQGYDDLRSFVLQSLRAEGQNVQERIVQIMDNYNMVMGEKAGSGLTINGAMLELVAQSSEGLLSSKRAAQELQNVNPDLFSKVKSFVRNVVARINAAIKGMDYEGSLSKEARALEKYRDQLADIWFNGRRSAMPGEPTEAQAPAEETPAAEGQKSYSVAQRDQAYMQAVESGNTEEQQRLVNQAAEIALADSKMRTEDGKLRVLYHGTNSDDFTVFDDWYIGTASGDSGYFGRGFYFAYSEGEAGFYGRKIKKAYLDIKKPFNYTEQLRYLDGQKTDDYNASRAVFVTNFAEKFPELANDHTVSVWKNGEDTATRLSLKEFADEYRKLIKDKKFTVEKVERDGETEYITYADKHKESYTDDNGKVHSWYEYGYQRRNYNEEAAKDQLLNAYDYMANNVYDSISIQNPTIIIMETDFSNSVKNRGYDGIIQSEDGDEAVVFDSSQIKLADPITYDDNGDVIPPSERFNGEKKDIRFSLAQPVEERADGLVAVHNLSGDQLLKTLKLGGFAMPSIAIVKNDYNHNRYGEISVVFGPDTIDPKAYRTNKVYGGDAWTPVYPRVEYKLNSKKMDSVIQYVRKIIPANMGINGDELLPENIQDAVNSNDGNMAEALKNKLSLMLAYATEKNLDIDNPMEEKALDGFHAFKNEQVVYIADALPENIIREYIEQGGKYAREKYPDLKQNIISLLNQQFISQFSDAATRTKLGRMSLYNDENIYDSKIDMLMHAAYNYLENGIENKINKTELKYKLQELLENDEDYHNWLNNLLEGAIEKSGIRNNKDLFTDYGNRRSWEALHDEETLDNVVRIMRAESDKGSDSLFGITSIFAAGTRDFRSIQEIKEHEGQLKHVSEDVLEEEKTRVIRKLEALTNELMDKNAYNSFIERDRVLEAIVNAITKGKTVSSIMKNMQAWRYNPSEEQAQTIIDIMEEVANLPTEYFEAKPKRAVGIDEIARVILPEDASEELKVALDNWGVEYATYDGTEEDRLAKVNAVPNVQFSIAEGPDMDVDTFMMGLNEFNLPTYQEKTMLRQYKSHKGTIKLLEEKIRTWEKERDEIMARGRLDPATQAKVDELNKAVSDAKAATKKKQKALIDQNNHLITEKWAIQKEGRRLTNDEKARLKEINQRISANSDEINGSSYDLSQLIRNTEEQKKALRGDVKMNFADSTRLSQINRRLEADRAKLNRMEKELVRITGEKGYASMMKNQRTIMENLVSGRTAEDLEDTVNAMQEELDTVTKEMEERADNLKKLASAEAVLKIRQMFDNRGLKRIAAKLKAEVGSELENSEIENRLALIALKMKQGKYDAENAEELADLLAGRIKREMTGYYIPALRGTTIVLGDVQMKELKGTHRTLADIRAQLAGTGIRISDKGGVTLDSKWERLCEMFPELKPDENVGNQLDALLKKITDEKSQQETVYNNEDLMKINTKLLEAAQELIPEIITDENSLRLIRESMAFVARVSGAAKSNAQALEDINNLIRNMQKKGESAVKTAKKLTGDIGETIDYFDQLSLQSEAAMWKEERLALIDQLKSENTKNLMEEAARWRERIEKDKSYREIAGENLQTRKRITTNVSRVKKLLINETDLKNIPEYMKGLAREMLTRIVDNDLGMRKLTGIDKKDLTETRRVLGEMRKLDGDFMPDDLKMMGDQEAAAMVFEAMADLEEGLQEYNSQRTGDMMKKAQAVKATLDKISDAVSTITSVINAERNVNYWDHAAPIQHVATKIRADMKNSRHKGEWKGTGSKAIEAVKQSVVYGNMTPEYFIEYLRNAGLAELMDDAKEGENRNGLEAQKAQDRLAQLGQETNFKAWANEKHDVTLGGKKRTITIGNMMELYAIWKREKTSNPEMSQHLNKGGVFFQEEETGGRLHREVTEQRAIRVTDEEILAMYDSMTENQKKLIEGVVSYLSNEMSQLGNEASMRMYGIRKYKELYYFPMKVWDGVKSARSDKGITGADENRMAHKSWSKRRQHMASNALVIGDFMTDAVNHIVEMINYNTMAPAIENINKVLNYKFTEEAGTEEETQRNLRVLFQQAYGRDALNYLETLMKDMNGGVTQDQRKTLRDKALTMFKKNAVAGSISVALQQPLSYIRASMMINPKYLAPAPVTSNWKNSYKEMMQYSGVAVIKRMGRFDMNFGQSAKDYIMPETRQSLYNRATDALTRAPELMDAMTWTWMWAATKAETAAKNPGMDTKSEAFLKLTAKRFNDVMRKTQVYDSVLVKSSNMRSNNLGMKVITSFMAEPTLSLNVLANAIRNVGAEGGKKHLAKALSTFFLSAIFQAGVKGLMGSGRTPDKKKTWLENFLNKFQYNLINEGNMISLIPGYSDLIEVLKTGELQDDAMGAIGKLSSIVDTLRKAAQGNGKGAWRDVEDTVGQFTQLLTNIPAKNLMRDARAIYNWIAGSEYADRPTSSAVLRYQTEANWFNADNLTGTINTWLGDAGFVSTNSRYYSRIYDAMKKGDKGTEKGIKEYLSLAKGVKDDTINTGIKNAAKKDTSMTDAEKDSWMIKNDLMGENNVSTITTQYKKGQISAAEAKKLWKELDPKLTDNDLYWKLDRADYQKETGADSVSGYSYRLYDAIAENKGESIRKAIKNMLDHGVKKESIKSAITEKWKEIYLNADSRTRTAIRDAIQKAYKAIGLKAEDANKVIDNWKKKK